jgi:hypothetical protein
VWHSNLIMLVIEPKSIVFRDVRLNQAYTTSLCISNPLAISVDFSLRPSNTRYHLSPNRVHLNPGQSIVVTVRLHIAHYPNYIKGVKGQSDSIQLSSAFFEQKIDATFFLHPRSSNSRSPSPNRTDLTSKYHEDSPNAIILKLQSIIDSRDSMIERLHEIVNELQQQHPNFQDIIEKKMNIERRRFEENSLQVLNLCNADFIL